MKRLEFVELSVVLCICMTVLEERVEAIIGGEYAMEGQIPYMVSVRQYNQFKCGGTLISPNFVLTAAHCVVIPNTTIAHPVYAFNVGAGTINLDIDSAELFNVAEIKVHPNYQFNWTFGIPNYDIALLQLPIPLKFTDKIYPIELATVAVQPGTIITASGWGSRFYQDPPAAMLRYVNLRVLPDDKCAEPAAFCTYWIYKKTCLGDSGGPAVYDGTLVGVLSFTSHYCISTPPEGFTKISLVRDWIIKNTDLTYII